MCGIAGFCNYYKDYTKENGYWSNILVNMREVIAHRGKDDTGEYIRKNVGFSHTRLAIRDINNGVQPMLRIVGGKEYAIVYNGEIYNTAELKNELIKEGYVFNTTTDTEVVLYGYIQFGEEFINKLNGIFAFSIWDEEKKRMILVRDRVGIKPLFYSYTEDKTVVFGSEIKVLFEHPDITAQIDINSMREIIGIGPARTSGNGVFKGIYEVKPGHILVFDKEGIEDKTYWNIICKEHKDSYKDTVEHVSYLVKDAIIRQLVSDVPVCSFLSGGIDSSIVTAIAANHLWDEGVILNTFSFDFEGNDKYFQSNAFQPERDRKYVDIMLDKYNTNHTYLECDNENLEKYLYKSVDAKDLPNMADVESSLLYFCSLVKKYNKVALTGECADEIFGGYPWFYREDLVNTDGFPWSKDMAARTVLLNDDYIRELDIDDYAREKYENSISEVTHLDNENPVEYRRREISYLNIKWFMQTLLDRMDRTSMYSGLEARVPFADHRIIEYVYNVPWDMKYRNGIEKWLLREACGDVLPKELLMRKKSPYPKTYNPMYEKILCDKFTEIINDGNSKILPIIDKKKVLEFIKKPSELGRPWFGQLMAAPQMMAYFIEINYWLEKYGLSL